MSHRRVLRQPLILGLVLLLNFVPSSIGDHFRVYQGKTAKAGKITWHTVVFTESLDNPKPVWCGGSLIHEKWVLTAAHCIAVPNLKHTFVGLPGVVRRSDIVYELALLTIPHPQFSGSLNDIGLLKLRTPAIGKNIKPIPLMKDPRAALVGKKCRLSGFGLIGNSTRIPDKLLTAKMVIVNNKVCQAFDDSLLCTLPRRGTRQSPCGGDSGGPIVVKIKRKPILVGLFIGNHHKGCESGLPILNTRVASHYQWITGEMRKYV